MNALIEYHIQTLLEPLEMRNGRESIKLSHSPICNPIKEMARLPGEFFIATIEKYSSELIEYKS